MDVNQDVQQRIFESIKKQLPKDEKIAVVLMNTLFLSQDAVYRRLRGDVPLSIYETKTLCEAYNISFDDIDAYKEGRNWLTTEEAIVEYMANRQRKR